MAHKSCFEGCRRGKRSQVYLVYAAITREKNPAVIYRIYSPIQVHFTAISLPV